jgi:hypothetical protein
MGDSASFMARRLASEVTPRRLLSLLCLAVSATALVGCGGDTLSLDPVASAASKTADAESARIAFSATVTASTFGTMTMQGRGIYDGRSKTGWMNMAYALPPAARVEAGGNPSMEMIFDGHDGLVMYMRSALLLRQLPSGMWVKFDLEKLAKEEGVDLSSLMNANQADPNQTLRMLMASSGARVSGSDRIRGVHTTRYAFRVDLNRLAKENKELRESLEQVIQVSGTDAYPAEAWIDAQGRVRRLKIAMSMNMPGAGAASMTLTEDLYDFGARATIFAPPDDQVMDFSQLVGG